MAKKPKASEFENAAREAGEGKSLEEVLRHLVKPQPKKKGDARKRRHRCWRFAILLALGLGWAGISGALAGAGNNTPESGEQATEVNKPLPPQAIAEGVALYERVQHENGLVGLHFVVQDCYAREVTQSSLHEATICMTADTIGFLMSRVVAREYGMPATPGFDEITWVERLVQSLDNFPHITRGDAFLQIRDDGMAVLWQPRK